MALSKIDVVNMLTGVTPLANGGTGATSFTTGITHFDQWRLTTDKTGLSGQQDITANLERVDVAPVNSLIGSAMTESSGIFTFPTTGIWYCSSHANFERASGSANYLFLHMMATTNNSSYSTIAGAGETLRDDPSSMGNIFISAMVDVTDTANVKIKFKTDVSDAQTMKGATDKNYTTFNFMRVGDT